MKKTTIAFLHTISLLIVPLIMIPIINWYKAQFNIIFNDFHYFMFGITWCLMFVIAVVRWIEAFSKKSISETKF